MICVLTESEVRLFESEGIIPACKKHTHIEAWAANEKVQEDLYRFVGHNKRRVTPQSSNAYSWHVRPSAGAEVWQLSKALPSRRQLAFNVAMPSPERVSA